MIYRKNYEDFLRRRHGPLQRRKSSVMRKIIMLDALPVRYSAAQDVVCLILLIACRILLPCMG